MHCLYINLDSQKERSQFVENNFRVYAARDWHLHRVAATDVKFVQDQKVQGILRDAEKACFISHISAIEQSKQHEGHVMIMEDDVLFGSHSCQLIEQALQSVENENWDILFTDIGVTNVPEMLRLFKLRKELTMKGQFSLLSLQQMSFVGATAYVINAKAKLNILALLKSANAINTPYDLLLRKLIQTGQLSGKSIFPFATSLSIHSGNSQIQLADTKITAAAWDAFRQLVWFDAEQNSFDPIASLKNIESSYFDKSSQDFMAVLGVCLSTNFKSI